jgi:hypothetical protein
MTKSKIRSEIRVFDLHHHLPVLYSVFITSFILLSYDYHNKNLEHSDRPVEPRRTRLFIILVNFEF